jgi:Tol biopolymer transport system component
VKLRGQRRAIMSRIMAVHAVLAVCLATGCLSGCGGEAAVGARGWAIAFVSNPAGNWDIYTINEDGTGLRQLTSSKARQYTPDWSPDGRRIVYDSEDGLHVMWADGGHIKRIIPCDRYEFAGDPAWSPDGERIAFVSSEAHYATIYVAKADGTDVQQLTGGETTDRHPTWSPDSSQIAFESNRSGKWEIYAMDADGSGVRQLTSDEHTLYQPAWSPDGSKIALTRSYDSAKRDICVMNADGSGLQQLTDDPSSDGSPDWSPNGRMIAFSSDRTGDHDIYVMKADGSNLRRLTHSEAFEQCPVWCPVRR